MGGQAGRSRGDTFCVLLAGLDGPRPAVRTDSRQRRPSAAFGRSQRPGPALLLTLSACQHDGALWGPGPARGGTRALGCVPPGPWPGPRHLQVSRNDEQEAGERNTASARPCSATDWGRPRSGRLPPPQARQCSSAWRYAGIRAVRRQRSGCRAAVGGHRPPCLPSAPRGVPVGCSAEANASKARGRTSRTTLPDSRQSTSPGRGDPLLRSDDGALPIGPARPAL